MTVLGAHFRVGRLMVAIAMGAGVQLIDGASTLALADDNRGLRAVPFVFVGAPGDCGADYPAGSNIVTSAWLRGMGLPDNGGNNFGSNPADNPNKREPHRGLLLSKNGTTPDCSSSGARILGVAGIRVTAPFQLGFDYRDGGHCGAGAPRFNVVVRPPSGPDTFHFVGGCANGTQAAAGQDPAQWTRTRFDTADPAQSFPIIPPNSRIRSITLIYDEGTDTPTAQDPNGVGLAVVDNIFINGKLITRGTGIAPDGDDDDGRREDEDAEWHSKELGGGQSADFPMTADANSLAVGAALDDGQLLIMEIYNPVGVLVGTSLPAVGRVMLSVPATVAGEYTIRLRNLGLTSVTTTVTLIKSVMR
jgi:hypothetical protein